MTHDPIFGSPTPSTPYAGTSGHSGSVASRDRAVREDANGTSGHRQQIILSALADAGAIGMTSAEFRDEKYALGHHGNISGALSVLHKDGKIACTRGTRNRCHVYLSLEAAAGFEPQRLRPFGGKPDGPMVYNATTDEPIGNLIVGTPGAGKALDQQNAAFRDALKGQFPAAYAVDAERTVAELPAAYRKPVLTEDERRLVAKARLNLNRFKGAQTMPVQTLSMQALLTLIERITA